MVRIFVKQHKNTIHEFGTIFEHKFSIKILGSNTNTGSIPICIRVFKVNAVYAASAGNARKKKTFGCILVSQVCCHWDLWEPEIRVNKRETALRTQRFHSERSRIYLANLRQEPRWTVRRRCSMHRRMNENNYDNCNCHEIRWVGWSRYVLWLPRFLDSPTNCRITGSGNRSGNSMVFRWGKPNKSIVRLIIVEIQIEMVGLPAVFSTCPTCRIIYLTEMREIWMLNDCTWSLYKCISIWSFPHICIVIYILIKKMGFSCVEIRSYLAQRVISAPLWSALMCGCRLHLIYIQLRFSDGKKTGSACSQTQQLNSNQTFI